MKKVHKKKNKIPESYTDRSYRNLVSGTNLISTMIRIEETDLHILADRDVTVAATDLVLQYRAQLENYILKNPDFSASLDPLLNDKVAPPLVRDMLQAGLVAGVGPMAAVAGAVAEYVGRGLLGSGCSEIIIENGGDVFLKRKRDCSVAIFAGESPLSYKVGVQLTAAAMPLGVCTSSGTVGHSLSLGEADSVTVIASSTPLADAVATRLGNEVGKSKDGKAGIENALARASEIEGISGVVVICGELMGAYGDVELVKVNVT